MNNHYRMNKKLSRSLAAVCVVACIITGVNFDGDGIGTINAATKLKLAKKKVTVFTGQKKTVKFSAPNKVKVSSASKKVAKATVKGKKITIVGVKKGKTKITVKCKKKKAIIKVTVKKKNISKNVNNVATPDPSPTSAAVKRQLKTAAPYAAAENGFSCEMFNGVKNINENSFISPYSIYMALAMLANGSSGNTQAQLLTALGTTDLADLNARLEGYNSGDNNPKVTINVANSLWLGKGQNLAPEIDSNFIAPLKKYYQADVFKDMDFSSSATVDKVNNWISDKTSGMLKNVVREFKPDTLMNLINTIYFNGRWSNVFNKNDTMDEPFYGTTSNSIVKMMKMSDVKYNYYCDDNFRGLSMNYGNSTRETLINKVYIQHYPVLSSF